MGKTDKADKASGTANENAGQAGEEAKDTVFKDDKEASEKTVAKDVKDGKAALSVAQRILELEKENAELKQKLALQERHIGKIDPKVLLKYKGLRKDFVFRSFDFSKGSCTMLRSEAKALIAHDPMCFAFV